MEAQTQTELEPTRFLRAKQTLRNKVDSWKAPLSLGTLGTGESPRDSPNHRGLALHNSQTIRSPIQTFVSKTSTKQDLA